MKSVPNGAESGTELQESGTDCESNGTDCTGFGLKCAQMDGIGRITLARPETHNALDQDAMRALTTTLNTWQNSGLRALILTGEGKSFCAGASLGDVAGSDWAENPLTTLCDTLETFPAPTVAALNGGVYGGGVEIALACDFRIGVRGMKAFVPPAKLGIHYEPAGIRRAMDRLGAQVTRRMFLLADTFSDEDLARVGFLDDLVAGEELGGAAETLATRIAGLAPLAVQGMKRTIVELSRGTLDEAAARERVVACFASEDHQEGLAAFREKREAVFKGG